jgi:hypothetical protein
MHAVNPIFCQVYKLLVEKTKSTPGAKVENNKFCLSVHFRCVDEKVGNPLNSILGCPATSTRELPMFTYNTVSQQLHHARAVSLSSPSILTTSVMIFLQRWNALAEQVKAVIKDYPKLKLTQGRKVMISSSDHELEHWDS